MASNFRKTIEERAKEQKEIDDVELWIAICVQATTNFLGCYVAMLVCEKYLNKEERK